MTIINLRDFYPWYITDELVEVSDEVAEAMRSDKLREAAPQELMERMENFEHLCRALNSLPETQGRRIDACIILGKSMTEVAEAEGVSVAAVSAAIERGLEAMRKFFKNN